MPRPDKHRAELGKIHILAKSLGMDVTDKDERSDYRAMLWTVARVHSARDLDAGGRARVLDHLARVSGVRARRTTPSEDRRPLLNKVRAQLAAAERDEAYGDAMARHMFGAARLEWCNPEQLRKIVAALAIDAKRRAQRAENQTP